MKELNEVPGKTKSETEYPRKKTHTPSAPEIETPVPPQAMDPSAPPGIEWKPSTSPGKRKRISKTYEKLNI